MRSWWWVLATMIVAAACDDEQPTGPVAQFAVPASGAIPWGAAPFPNDLYLAADGTVELASLPSDRPLWEAFRAELAARRGFCGTCPIWFPIEGEIDRATVASGTVMIDPAGMRIPVESEWHPEAKVIAVRPTRGHVLAPGGRFVVALTDAIRGVDGAALRADEGFRAARARDVVEPALAALSANGAVAADEVVAVAAFTVADPAAAAVDLGARVRAYFAANGAPALVVDRVWRANDGSLDELMGTPAQVLPGIDVPAAGGTAGTVAMAHDHVALLIKGRFQSVRAITGTGDELGTPRPDVVAGEQVPFVLAIPTGASVSNLPVVVFQHGAGGTIASGLGLANTVAAGGAAFLSLETFQHGERASSGSDSTHDLRGDNSLGPDGLFTHDTLAVALRAFALTEVPAEHVASPRYIAGTLTQMIADLHALFAVVYSSDLAPLAAADPSLANLAFDREHTTFIGASLGTLVGTAALVGDDRIGAAVMNVPIAGMVATAVESSTYRPQVELLVLSALDVPNTTYEPDAQLSMHPLLGFYQWAVADYEPAALVRPLLARAGRAVLWQLAGLDELAGVAAGDHLVAVAGVPGVGAFSHAEVVAGTSPLADRGAVRFAQADHFMAITHAGSSNVLPPGLPPFDQRPAPLAFANPVVDVQAQLGQFLRTWRETGTGEISTSSP